MAEEKKQGFVKKVVKSNISFTSKVISAEAHKANYEYGKVLIKSLFKRPEKRTETWEESIQRTESTTERVVKVYSDLRKNFFIALTGFLVCLGLIAYYLACKEWAAAASSLSISSVLFVLMLKNSFKCYQIKHKSWQLGFKDFYQSFSEWLPTPLKSNYTITKGETKNGKTK